ncbi:MAG: ATP-binding protein, partial [Bacteroidota bacterium]|nr:ATP-binding protein [Bacteroidota bacterium]
ISFPRIGGGSESWLGLSIVKDVVDLHRGFITVESRKNEGTTFRVILPADPAAA